MIKHLSNVSDITKPYYKIFCNFHKKDLEHFAKIKKDIFDICKCSLSYCESDSEPEDEKELEFTVANSNLYVLIVSSNLLFDSNLDMQPYQMAIKNNIPILPILVENGLEEIFNEKFGNIQCISTCLEALDPTAVPYIEKLQNFLTQSFSLSFDVDKIRGSFDTSIFLSYRKKDRLHAQKLLEIIHSSDKLKNIAVWYDEFLIPGEDFNDSIRSELENSAIFMLMVTPSILEDKNYIKIVEYPIAQSLNKSIIPVETVPTNAAQLQTSYPDIPKPVTALSTEHLKDVILDVLKENGVHISERTAERDLFIGFAFLKGLYVEKNTSIAFEMIERSADAGIIDAIKMLVSIYKYGDGCAINTEKAAMRQREYIQYLISRFENEPTQDNAVDVLNAYKSLSDIFVRNGDTDNAAEALSNIISFLDGSPFKNDLFAKKHSAETYESMAFLFINAGNYNRARYEYLEKAINLRKEIYDLKTVENAAVDLVNAYLALARCQAESDDIIGLKQTIKVDLKQTANTLLEYRITDVHIESLQTLQKVVSGLNRMGEYLNLLNMQDKALIFIGTAVNLADAINRHYNTVNTAILAYNAFKNDGLQHIKINVENHLRVAEDSFTNAHNIALSLLEQSETTETVLIVAESYINMARIMHKLKNSDAAIENLNSAFEMYKSISATLHTLPAKQKLYQSYYFSAEIYSELKDFENALLMFDKGLAINDDIIQNSHLAIYKLEMADALKQKGEILKKQWEFDEALNCFAKMHQLVKAGAHKNAHIFLIAESYEKLIAAHKSLGNIEEANALTAELNNFKNEYSFMFNGTVHLYS